MQNVSPIGSSFLYREHLSLSHIALILVQIPPKIPSSFAGKLYILIPQTHLFREPLQTQDLPPVMPAPRLTLACDAIVPWVSVTFTWTVSSMRAAVRA